MNKPLPVIIDCDPGQDDAVALALAFSAPEIFEILGVTTVAGNVPLNLTQRNARLVCEICNRSDVEIYAGCDKPMKRELVTAEYVHGQSGLDGIDIYEPEHPLEKTHAIDFIIETLMAADDNSITLIPTGPLTNIGTAIAKEPTILPKIKEIILMGGAAKEGGNVTPSAEFNIYVDPEAADIVFKCGRPIVVMSLDVTHQVLTSRKRLDRIRAIGTKTAKMMTDLIVFYERYDEEKYHTDGGPLYDPCTIAYVLKPGLFKLKDINVTIETQGELTRGETVADFWNVTGRKPNVQWAYEVDDDGFFDLLNKQLKKI